MSCRMIQLSVILFVINTMKNIFKYTLLAITILFSWIVFSATTGFDIIGNTPGYYYNRILPSSLEWTWVQSLLFNVFFVLAGFLFIVALIVAFIAAIRLFVSNNNEEDFSKWTQTLIWSIWWLFLVAISYWVMRTLSDTVFRRWTTELNVDTIYRATINIIYPILNFIRYIAAICFFCVIVYAFYKIIFAIWDEEGFQSWKKTFIAAAIGFIIMLAAEPIVRMAYGWSDCGWSKLFGIPTECTNRIFDTNIFLGTIVKIIIFLNGFIALVTIIMIMYAGFLILTGWWDEEKSEKAKKTITYAIIGVLIILFSYVIYRAFLFNVS